MDNFDFDDVLLALKGRKKELPRHLYSLWKHFPGKDLKSNDLIKAHCEFQDLVKSDLIKISPHSKYALVDFGVGFDEKDFNKDTGSYITKKYPIKTITDWEKIDEFDPQTGELGKQLEVVKQITTKYPNIPAMMTIFLPTMIARKLVQNDSIIEHFTQDKKLVTDRLQVITKVMVEYSKTCVEMGSKGLFLATQETDLNDGWTKELWSTYAYPFDRQVVEKLKSKTEFQVLHLHGEKIFFKEVLEKFKVNTVNFHAFKDFPTFFNQPEMKHVFSGGLLGGLEEKYFDLVKNNQNPKQNPLEVLFSELEQVSDRIIIGPNCVVSQTLTSEDIVTIITTLRG